MTFLGLWVVVQAFGANGDKGFDRWVGWANIHALWVSGLGVALLAFDKIATRSPQELVIDSAPTISQIVVNLAARIEDDWAREAGLRQVTNPAPVMVRWSSTGRPAASRGAVLGVSDGKGWRDLPLEGGTY